MYTCKLLPTHIYGLMYICSSKKVDNIVCFGSNPATTRVFYGKTLGEVVFYPAKPCQGISVTCKICENPCELC